MSVRREVEAQTTNEARRITGGGDAVTAVNADGSEIDGQAWRWDVDDGGEALTIVVQVTGQARSEQPARPEVTDAIASRGRSVVDELVGGDDPLPRRVTLLQRGHREVVA
jgi:hypothetical protein